MDKDDDEDSKDKGVILVRNFTMVADDSVKKNSCQGGAIYFVISKFL